MTDPKPRPLTRQEYGRIGGLVAAHNMSADQRQARARKGGIAAREKLGPAHYLRMNYVKSGRLPREVSQ